MISKTTIPDPGLPTSVADALARMAADAKGPFGRTPLARLAEAHIAVFEELRLLRASWRPITFLLAAYGITGENGPYDEQVLRANLSRAGKARNVTKRAETKRCDKKTTASRQNDSDRSVTERNTRGRNATKPNERHFEPAGRAAAVQTERQRLSTASSHVALDAGLALRAALIRKQKSRGGI